MSQTEYAMVYRCESEWNDCSWSTLEYGEIASHEALPGHFVSGRMEAVAKRAGR